MGRKRLYLTNELLIVGALVFLMLAPACRKELPPLDRNRAPETYITNAPTETTATDYKVHMYWRGTDPDGVVTKYIYYISDTLVTLDPEAHPEAEALDWNPDARIADYLKGRFTTSTDMVVIFKGYNDLKGAMVNKQAFHIAAIDDQGKIDPTPARLQFNARVKGLPTVRFWTDIGNGYVPFNRNSLDTISMFVPFSVKFLGTTLNNSITGYRWSYGDNTYPSYNGWYIPASQTEQVAVTLPKAGEVIPSGIFNLKVTARDEAGALSKTDVNTGEGVCKVVVNHDPNTRIIEGLSSYVPQSTGVREEITVDFNDGIPDTLPYNSLLTMFYLGWDDPKDLPTLQYKDPALPIRFQFQFRRWTYDEYGALVADKSSPWYPLEHPEDTNPKADLDPEYLKNRDSTSMRVATFNYIFSARSYDEQNKADGTPASVNFYGNFPPKLDSVQVGHYDPKTSVFIPAQNDTLRFGWLCNTKTSCAGRISPYLVTVNSVSNTLTKSYKFVIRAGGHDDRRDPPDSGIKGWRYRVTDPDDDLAYYKEGEWMFDKPLNEFEQECAFSISVPYFSNLDSILAQADSLVAHPPAFLGTQNIEIVGADISDSEQFHEEIRGITPLFDENGIKIPGSYVIRVDYYFANYARKDARSFPMFFRLEK